MAIDHVEIYGFRNLKNIEFNPSPSLTLLVGHNGQGKTNILEALYLLLQGHSFRSHSDRELLPFGCSPDHTISLSATVSDGDRQTQWNFRYGASSRRKQNQQFYPTVIFSPDDLELSRGAPAARRQFLDTLLSGLDTRYAKAVRLYQRAVSQRNKALKDGHWSIAETFVPTILQQGQYLWIKRYNVYDQLMPIVQGLYRTISIGEQVEALYISGGSPGRIESLASYEQLLRTRQAEERQRLITLVGPHRDDIQFTLNGHSMIQTGSQGQQRTLALAIKLATYQWLKQETNRVPLVLLDDVLSELDRDRRTAVLSHVADDQAQTIVTDTEARDFGQLDPVIYVIKEGAIFGDDG